MKNVFLLIWIILFINCDNRSKTKVRSVTIPEIGWTFQMPDDLRFKDSSFNSAGEITWDNDTLSIFHLNSSKLFLIDIDFFNNFKTIVLEDTSSYADWRTKLDLEVQTNFELLKESKRYKLLDTSYRSTIIANVPFQKEVMKVFSVDYKDTAVVCTCYGKLSKYEINFSYSFNKKKYEKEFESIILSSTFKQ